MARLDAPPSLLPGHVRLTEAVKQFPTSRRVRDPRQLGPRWMQPVPKGTRALDSVTLEIEPGSTLGVIGKNGAGKSTLLRLVAGVTAPTSGSVQTGGRVVSLIEIGIGFHPDLTGRENVQVGATLLGVPQETLRRRLPEIIEFSGLGDALDSPVKKYSTGMVARLGFSLAVHADADVLAVDEVLAVGDVHFQRQCLDKVHELVDAGTTLLFVSHELPLVGHSCERAIRLEHGRIVDDGPAADVIEAYLGRPVRSIAPGPPAARVSELRLAQEHLPTRGHLEVSFDLEVLRPVGPFTVTSEVSVPTLAPDLVITRHRSTLDVIDEPSVTHHLVGTSSSFPWSGGDLRLTVFVADGTGHTVAVREADFSIEGSSRAAKPQLVIIPTVVRTPVAPPEPESAVSIEATVGGGSATPVQARGLTKTYSRRRRRGDLRAALPGSWGRAPARSTFALDEVDLDVDAGDSIGVIGSNGAGKSTLLRALSGLLELDSGEVGIDGRVVSMLEVGVGFHGELTGRENLRSSARMMGAGTDWIDDTWEDIAAMAGLAEVLDVPVKRYSTGMRARLGFAMVIHLPADVLLIDEALSVGDQDFRRSAVEALNRRRRRGTAVVFVSHNLGLVEQICRRTIRLDKGRVVDEGTSSDVLQRFGGVGWSANPYLGTLGVHLHDLQMGADSFEPLDRLRLSVLVEVVDPRPTYRVEVAWRVREHADSSVALTLHQMEMVTIGAAVVCEEGSLTDAGWFRLEIDCGELPGFYSFDVVVSVVDAHLGAAVAEVWAPVVVTPPPGRESESLGLLWEVGWDAVAASAPEPST